ncbi:hypothetical protein [Nonomuraea longicatena]|uniref:hypothetical protein n=1 Tax=Nonomuraea longicatena TaxID=83682 RepID=UPI0031E258D4
MIAAEAPHLVPSAAELTWSADLGQASAVDVVCSLIDRTARLLLDTAPGELRHRARGALAVARASPDPQLRDAAEQLTASLDLDDVRGWHGLPFAEARQVLDALLVAPCSGHAPGIRIRFTSGARADTEATVIGAVWGMSGLPYAYKVRPDGGSVTIVTSPADLVAQSAAPCCEAPPIDPARTDTARTEPARTDTARTQPARTEPARTDTAPSHIAPSCIAPSCTAPSDVASSDVAPASAKLPDLRSPALVPTDDTATDATPFEIAAVGTTPPKGMASGGFPVSAAPDDNPPSGGSPATTKPPTTTPRDTPPLSTPPDDNPPPGSSPATTKPPTTTPRDTPPLSTPPHGTGPICATPSHTTSPEATSVDTALSDTRSVNITPTSITPADAVPSHGEL